MIFCDSYTKNVFKTTFSVDFQKISYQIASRLAMLQVFIPTTQSYKAKKIFIQDDNWTLDTYIQSIVANLQKQSIFQMIYASAQSQRIIT